MTNQISTATKSYLKKYSITLSLRYNIVINKIIALQKHINCNAIILLNTSTLAL